MPAVRKYLRLDFFETGKGGKEVWIQGSYNPILDLNGRPYKVVKYATDVTDLLPAVTTPTLILCDTGERYFSLGEYFQ